MAFRNMFVVVTSLMRKVNGKLKQLATSLKNGKSILINKGETYECKCCYRTKV